MPLRLPDGVVVGQIVRRTFAYVTSAAFDPKPVMRRRFFIAMRATDPLQHLLYFVRAPWPWGKPHEAAGIHRTSRRRCSRMAARGAPAAGRAHTAHRRAGGSGRRSRRTGPSDSAEA